MYALAARRRNLTLGNWHRAPALLPNLKPPGLLPNFASSLKSTATEVRKAVVKAINMLIVFIDGVLCEYG